MTDPAHDPGWETARARADAVPLRDATIVRPPGGGAIRVGTAGWTDRTLTAAGVFYPPSASSAEERLRYYASRFPLVEVDATYYALPARRSAELWLARTPDDFTFNVKANALMTGHATEVARLPKELREALPEPLRRKDRIYGQDLPPELYDAVWRWFIDAVEPLHAAGKLGAVLLQYPRWFVPSREHRATLADAKRRLGGLEAAVEFRSRRWFQGSDQDRTLGFLAEHDLPFVMVDEPQGHESSVPPIVAVTSPRLAVLRLHGRRAETWEGRNVGVEERFRYLYSRDELQEWIPKILEAIQETRELHVICNNCHANYGITNALELTLLLSGATGQVLTRGGRAGAAGTGMPP